MRLPFRHTGRSAWPLNYFVRDVSERAFVKLVGRFFVDFMGAGTIIDWNRAHVLNEPLARCGFRQRPAREQLFSSVHYHGMLASSRP